MDIGGHICGPFPSPHSEAGLVSETSKETCAGMSVHLLCIHKNARGVPPKTDAC